MLKFKSAILFTESITTSCGTFTRSLNNVNIEAPGIDAVVTTPGTFPIIFPDTLRLPVTVRLLNTFDTMRFDIFAV